MTKLLAMNSLTAASTALALSDGTPVEFVKITSRDRIQVRVPADHPLANQDDGGEDPTLRIFARDGSHFKNRTDLTLVATDSAAPAAAPSAAPIPAAAAPVANDNTTYEVDGNTFDNLRDANDNTTYEVDGNTFDNLRDAKDEAIDLFGETGADIEIVAVTRTVIGRVGYTALAA